MFHCRRKILNVNCTTYLKVERFLSEFENSQKLFTDYFGLHRIRAIDYVKINRIENADPDNVMKVINYCKKIGFTDDRILANPMLLRIHPTTIDQYYLVMKEGGFKNITPEILSKFRTVCKRKVSFLKEYDVIDPKTDVVASFITHLTPCPENFYVTTKGDEEIFTDIHLKILCNYIKWRLNASDDDIDNLLKVHPTICRKSFKYLCENIAMAEKLGFTPEKMLKYGYILHAYPHYTREILEKYPFIAGTCMKRAMRMYPKLVTTPTSNVEKILKILKQHNIPDEAIAKRMNVLHLSPETVELRLQELRRVSDFKVLLHNPNVLKLIVHHNRAKSRLSFLKQLQLKCASVSVLGNDNAKFDIHIREGRDTNTSSDTYAFLKGILNKNVDEFEDTLKKHPYYLQVPLLAMQETYNYLKKEKFTNAAIFEVIYILLYPKEKIESGFKQVNLFANQQKKTLTQVNRLNLVLYFIEKEHHFTGDGVWVKSETVEESVT